SLRRALAELHPADVAELMDSVDDAEEMVLFRLAGRRKTEVFAYLAPLRQLRILRTLEPEQLSLMVGQMPADDRTRLLEAFPEDVKHTLLGRLPPSEVKQSLALLGYPEDTAGRYMTPNYAAIRPGMTAAEALEHIRRTGRGKETLNVVYLIDEKG